MFSREGHSSQFNTNGNTAQKDRRRRKRVAYRMDVTSSSGSHAGCMLDISTEGLRMLCTPGVDLSCADDLRLMIPRWLDLGVALTLPGRFIWSKPFGDAGEVEAGYVFDKLSNKARVVLAALVERIEEIYGSA